MFILLYIREIKICRLGYQLAQFLTTFGVVGKKKRLKER